MSFGKDAPDQPSSPASTPQLPPRKRKYNWLRYGVLLTIFGAVNLIFISLTGKSLLTRGGGKSELGLDTVLTVIVLVFGAVLTLIQLQRSNR